MLDAFLDALIDTLKILPFLFAAYLAMEYLESHTEDRIRRFVKRAGWMGPFGAAFWARFPSAAFRPRHPISMPAVPFPSAR